MPAPTKGSSRSERLLVRADTIFAGDPPAPGPSAFVVERGLIAWVGSADAVPAPWPERRVDAGDAVVIPGFVDCHIHLLALAPTSGWADLRGVRSPREARARVAEHAARVPEGRWVVGWGYDASKTGGRRLLRTDLDAISPERPAMIIESALHQGTVNSPALAALGWGRWTPRWPGGELVRDRRGEPTGLVWERAFGVPALKAIEADVQASPELLRDRFRILAYDLLAQGVTHIGEAFTPPLIAETFQAAELSLGVTMLPTSGRGLLSSPWDALGGPRTGEGDARLGVGPVKVVADGAERAAMCLTPSQVARMSLAALSRAARARDGTAFRLLASLGTRWDGARIRTGTLHYSRVGLAEVAAAALGKGYLVAIHALGNDALDMALHALEEARRASGREVTGCRIEHAMFGRPADFRRASELGVMLSMQPGHARQYAPLVRSAGLDTLFHPVPIRWALEAGCRVAISSDSPTVPGSALENLRTAVERTGVDGEPVGSGQGISPIEALRAATGGGAEACGVQSIKGSIEVGKQADFAILSDDPFDPSTRVRETWIGGRRVWSSGEADQSPGGDSARPRREPSPETNG